MSDADLNPPTLTQEQEGSPSDGASSPELTTTPAFQTSPATVKRRQRHLLERLRRSVSRQPHDIGEGMDKVVFGVAATATIAFVAWGFVDPHGLGRVSKWALGGTISNFGWLFVLSSTLFVVFIVFVAASRFGKIPLGGDAEEPEYSTGSWVSMMFATGMGIGLIFYGVGEPLYFYMSPPPDTVDPQTAKAASTAMGTALFHWTIYPWAMYALVGLGMAYGTYRLGRSQLFSAMFTSLFGRQAIDGVGGRIINILAIVATLFGSACSLGLGALQIGGGMVSTNLVDKVSSGMLVAIIAVLTACFVASAISGIEKGIQWLSNINMVLAVLLAIIVFVGGPTLFILNIIPSAIGDFIDELPAMASRTAAVGNKANPVYTAMGAFITHRGSREQGHVRVAVLLDDLLLGLVDLLDALRGHVHRPHLARPHHPAIRYRGHVRPLGRLPHLVRHLRRRCHRPPGAGRAGREDGRRPCPSQG